MPIEALASSVPGAAAATLESSPSRPQRIASIDALRGFVMFTMIFVNDLAGAPRKLVPDWMVHYSDRHRGGSGMTFVDLVFPAFLFIVGMSIPFALGSRLAKGEPFWKVLVHVFVRAASLLAIGILMVNGESAANNVSGWSATLWSTSMFLACIYAFCVVTPRGAGASTAKFWRIFNLGMRVVGFAGMLYLAFTFHGRRGQEGVISLSPFSIHT